MVDERPPEHGLIDEYLGGVAVALRTRPDAADITAELRDHLLTATERHLHLGVPPEEAEQLAITEMGCRDEVARSFLQNQRGAPAIPTRFTTAAGVAAHVVPFGLAVALVGSYLSARIDDRNGWAGAAESWYSVAAVGSLAATVCLLVLLAAVVRRHGGLGWPGRIALTLGALGTFLSSALWLVAAWAPILGIAWTLVAAAALPQAILPTRPMRWIAVGLASLLAVQFAAAELAGTRPFDGDWAVTAIHLLIVGCVAAVAWGAVGLGRLLAGETPHDAASVAGPTAIGD